MLVTPNQQPKMSIARNFALQLQVDARDGCGSTPLLVALICNHVSCACLLAKFKADLEVRHFAIASH